MDSVKYCWVWTFIGNTNDLTGVELCHIYKELIFNQSLLPEKVKKKIKQKRQLEKKYITV